MLKKLSILLILLLVPLVILQSRATFFYEPQRDIIQETRQEQEPEQETIVFETTDPTEPKPKPQTKSPVQPQNGGSTHKNYYGRLFIPDADIDVALYYGIQQSITNRQDSANIFSMSVFNGLYIADHNTQEFKKLSNVKVGMRGSIQLANGAVLNIKCTEVLSGRNTGDTIEDENGNTNLDADYLMYTCIKGQRNILICLWKHN